MDAEAVNLCSDDKLKEMGLKAMGDILALRHFVSSRLKCSEKNDNDQAKKDLVSVIRRSRTAALNDDTSTNRKKSTKIILGWQHFNVKTNKYSSVRKAGRSRTITVDKTDKLNSIADIVLKLFFAIFTNISDW